MDQVKIINSYLRNMKYSIALSRLLNESATISLESLFREVKVTNERTKQSKRSFWKEFLDDNDNFSPQFVQDIKNKVIYVAQKEEKLRHTIKEDISHMDVIPVDRDFNKKSIHSILRANPNIGFVHPSPNSTGKLDYNKETVQLLRINNMSEMVVTPFYVSYAFKCNLCNEVAQHPAIWYDSKPVPKFLKCECDKKAKKFLDLEESVHRQSWATEVYSEDNTPFAVFALAEIPQGDADVSVLVCKTLTKYYFMLLSYRGVEQKKVHLKFEKGEHRIWQLIRMIDKYHDEVLGKHMVGLDWIKVATLLQKVVNVSGYASFNFMVNAPPGIGKNALSRLWLFTLHKRSKIQPANSLSIPGLRGSSHEFTAAGNKVTYYQSGLMQNHSACAVDEVFDLDPKVLIQFKNYLSEESMNTTVARNSREIPKHCSIIGLTNQNIASAYKFEKEVGEELLAESVTGGVKVSIYSTEEFDGDETLSRVINNVKKKMFVNGVNWMDGQDLTFLERFNLIFYVKPEVKDDSPKSEEQIKKEWEDGEVLTFKEKNYDDNELKRKLYNDSFSNYLRQQSELKKKFKWDVQNQVLFENLFYQVRKHVEFVSESRLKITLMKIIEALALIDNRTKAEKTDFDICLMLLKKCFKWTSLKSLRRD